jgi:predicted kinase
VRSDVERKRMQGIPPLERVGADVGASLYSPAATASTYARLRDVARAIVEGGRIAIVDAAFLRRSQRESFRALAAELGVPFVLVALEADEATLRRRILDRSARGTDASDADLAVLAHQIATREPLTADERAQAVVCDADAPLEAARALAASRAVSRRIAA